MGKVIDKFILPSKTPAVLGEMGIDAAFGKLMWHDGSSSRFVQPDNSSLYPFMFSTMILGQQSAGDFYATVSATASSSGGGTTNAPQVFNLAASEVAVSTRTAKLNLAATLITNATAPAYTVIAQLYPVSSVGGAAGQTIVNLGAAVTGSSVTFTSPAASTVFTGTSGDFSLPSDGAYILGCNINTTGAVNTRNVLNVQLRRKNS